MFYVYLIKGKLRNDNLYIGYTSDLKRRVKEHGLSGKNLVYYEAYKSEVDARKREIQLKKYKSAWGQLKKRTKTSRI